MKKILVSLICLLYTFVSIGGSIYMHNCSGETSLSIYEKKIHEACPMCASHKDENKTCHTGDCKDVEVKIDQLKDQFFSTKNMVDLQLSPTILTRLWVLIKPTTIDLEAPVQNNLEYYIFADSSPPLFILHSIFRI